MAMLCGLFPNKRKIKMLPKHEYDIQYNQFVRLHPWQRKNKMEIISDVIGRRMFSVECSIETDVSRNKGSFGVKRYTIGPVKLPRLKRPQDL